MPDASTSKPVALCSDRVGSRIAILAGLTALVFIAVALRAIQAANQSAYMDEATYIQVGGILLAHRLPSPDLVGRDFGSYLWPILAAAMDRVGGLLAVRLLTAVLGAFMVLGSVLFAYRCTHAITEARRRRVALIAGFVMAVFPTAIAIGRFGTYDALAGACFMCGVALVVPVRNSRQPLFLPLAAALLFVGFLSKYVLAIYFPFLCLYLMLRSWSLRQLILNSALFVLPLAAFCSVYAFFNWHQLAYLLHFSSGYSDLRSDFPLREYLLQRGDLLLLGLLAIWGLRSASRECKEVTLGGVGVIFAFQAFARADYDFWKHSIYSVYFLAPLAAIAIAPVVEWLVEGAFAGAGLRPSTGTERLLARTAVALLILWQIWLVISARWSRTDAPFLLLAIIAGLAIVAPPALVFARGCGRSWLAPGVALMASAAVGALLALPLANAETAAQSLVGFYPNLNPSQRAIRTYVSGAERLLVDDSAVRYYVRDEVPYDRVTDPFFIDYRGAGGIDAYRQAIDDRHFDAIVLDGGIGPQGQAIRQDLEGDVEQNYDRVYANASDNGTSVEIFRPRAAGAVADVSGFAVTLFDSGNQGWGAHPSNGELLPGQGIAVTDEQPWQSHPVLKFASNDSASEVGFAVKGAVSKFQADVYLAPSADAKGASGSATATVGMVGFDQNWAWHDDGFQQLLPAGKWEHISWQLSQPGFYNEVGLKLPDGGRWTLYVGRVALQP
jgi:4-amino-4-deoxy-L-arabinose transferase-like glycosyltransferase